MKRLFLLLVFCPLFLFGLPQGLDVQVGTAPCTSKGSRLHIQNSKRAILHWNDFSIGKGEKVHFDTTALNRVTEKNVSHLLGSLTSNGSVFLINPNGVYIGGSASIQTAGFLAST